MRAEAATEKRKTRPVSEVYNCPLNLYKFCRPIGLESAKSLEVVFAQ